MGEEGTAWAKLLFLRQKESGLWVDVKDDPGDYPDEQGTSDMG